MVTIMFFGINIAYKKLYIDIQDDEVVLDDEVVVIVMRIIAHYLLYLSSHRFFLSQIAYRLAEERIVSNKI